MLDNSEAKNYVVVDNLYKTYETGDYTVNAKLVDFAKAESDVTLSKVTPLTSNVPVKGHEPVEAAVGGVDFSLDNAKAPNSYYYGLIFSYNDKVLEREGENTTPTGAYAHAKNDAELKKTDGYTWTYKLTEDTQFLVKKAGTGEYETYTGYTALPALTAGAMDYVTDAAGYCTLVYLSGVVYGDETVTGYVASFEQHDWADGFERVTVYVAGEATTVLVRKDDINNAKFVQNLGNLQTATGVYSFTTSVDKNGNVYATSITAKDASYGAYLFNSTVKAFDAKNTVVTLVDVSDHTQEKTVGLTNVKIYDARGGVLKVIDAETFAGAQADAEGLDPTATLTVKVYSTGNDKIDGIYIVG